MSEESPSPNEGAKAFNPKFRKRKRHQGGSWTPRNESAELGDGAWCRFHKQRHGYMTMGLSYGRDSKGNFQLLWYCKQTKEVLETVTLHKKEED